MASSLKRLLLALLLLLALPLRAAEPEIAATRIFVTDPFALPKPETRATWSLADAKPDPLTDPIRIMRLQIFWGVDGTRPGEAQRKADLRITVVRERIAPNGDGRKGTVVTMIPHDHYTEPSGNDVISVIDLSPGFVVRPDDRIAILYGGEPVFLPAGAIPTKANLNIVAYWIPEPVEVPVLGN